MKRVKSFRDYDLKGKTVFLRSDLNSDFVRGSIIKGERIRESLKTIQVLKKMKARVVILAHQGNPGKKNFTSLKGHAKLLGRGVKFIEDIVGEKAVLAIKGLNDGEAILLENVRMIDDEFNPKNRDNLFAKNLLPLCDVYINDAFSVMHRNHFSIVGFSKVKEKYVGLLAEKEISALEKINLKDSLFILGGSKPETDIKLLGRKNKVIVCGLFAQMCLVSQGFDFGYQNDFLKKETLVKGDYKKFLKKLKGKLSGVEMPVDFAVDLKGKREEFKLDDFPMSYEIEDIGKVSMEKFSKMIRSAKSIYMKGPAGWIEDNRFRKGTFEILKAVSNSKGFSLIGGGQLSSAIKNSRIPLRKFGHVSLSGGACLAYVAGEKLPGLQSLGYY